MEIAPEGLADGVGADEADRRLLFVGCDHLSLPSSAAETTDNHMGGIGSGRLGTMGGTVGRHARVAHNYGRHDRRFDPAWGGDYAASCVIYEPYYGPWGAGDVDGGILSPGAVY
jgi:hypothetical protein